jgi:two-component system response regulator QseB
MRLLILEDDPQLGDALATGLRQLGHAVDWFAAGAQADAAIDSAPYDAAVLDLGLPGIAGLDVGADDYLIKPISTEELAARLRAMLRRATGRAQSEWTHGALRYDTVARQVHWQGRPVELTARELALLEVLLKHPQRVLSKAQLQEQLYDWSGREPESNTLEVHVHRLRRKIHPDIVRTVRGVGYALGAEVPA